MVNVVSSVWKTALAVPARIAIRSGGSREEWTFGALCEASARAAAAVRAAGVEPLDRVILIAPAVAEFAVLYYGLLASGATVVTLNTMSTAAEIRYVIDDSRPALVIAWHSAGSAARDAAARAQVPFWQVGPGAHFDGPPISEVWEHEPSDTAVILYTSGTTGKPKGAELTAGNLVAVAAAFRQVFDIDAEDRVGSALPLFHVYGQAVIMNTTLVAGGSLSLLERFDASAMLDLVRDHRLTAVAAVPAMWISMLHASDGFSAEDFTALRLGISGGASIPEEILRAYRDRFGCTVLEGYGLTETTGGGAFNDIRRPQRPGTVGPALPGLEIQVRAEGEVLVTREVGEVFVRGATVMKGYWRRPVETAEALKAGWLSTGDLGHLDADGYLTIVGRKKELIIRGGYNVYPREVEEVLYRHPDILDAAVIGVPDERLGEEVGALVVVRAGVEMDAASLRVWAKKRLSAYKVPHLIGFVRELPKGATGKVLKRAIDPTWLRAQIER